MRYTTIIDISEFPAIYRNHATRLVYLHLVLKSGYHDYDRDLTTLSIRRIALETGLSVAAIRNAIEQLTKYHLISRKGQITRVRKFIVEQPFSKRAKTKNQAEQQLRAAKRAEQEKAQADERQATQYMVDRYHQEGKTPFMVYYEQQQEAARAGDQEAATFCAQQERIYKMHASQFKTKQQ